MFLGSRALPARKADDLYADKPIPVTGIALSSDENI
jgi:hypothetical protein